MNECEKLLAPHRVHWQGNRGAVSVSAWSHDLSWGMFLNSLTQVWRLTFDQPKQTKEPLSFGT